jgi:hypothetical protein
MRQQSGDTIFMSPGVLNQIDAKYDHGVNDLRSCNIPALSVPSPLQVFVATEGTLDSSTATELALSAKKLCRRFSRSLFRAAGNTVAESFPGATNFPSGLPPSFRSNLQTNCRIDICV